MAGPARSEAVDISVLHSLLRFGLRATDMVYGKLGRRRGRQETVGDRGREEETAMTSTAARASPADFRSPSRIQLTRPMCVLRDRYM